ncbi:hypothetical protein [Nonomuraea sp. SYSU D8015]|uniref:hypothetical protein n=1 Tax=Nonomuraea sp. SYSU D8015 TaxID=2593644 RepID=UPI0016608655|nr:hypothetical protein [Nonomuraea sp. SYSU D8015]
MSDPSELPVLPPDAAAFYTSHSVFSSPGALAGLYADLPADPGLLARIVRDLMIHRPLRSDRHGDGR